MNCKRQNNLVESPDFDVRKPVNLFTKENKFSVHLSLLMLRGEKVKCVSTENT